jgi:hypothetical protein
VAPLLPTTTQKQRLLPALHLRQSLLHLALPGKMTQQKQQLPWSLNQQLAIKRLKTFLQ